MFGFNGEFRRKPNVDIRGASKTQNKHELLRKAQEDRHKREMSRLENRSAIKIQSLVRRFLARQATKKLFRAQFDDIRKERFAGGQTFVRKVSLEQMEALLLRLFMCFSVDEDKERLLFCCQRLIECKEELLSKAKSSLPWRHKLARVLALNLRQFSQAAKEDNINVGLRLMEVATCPQSDSMVVTFVFRHLLDGHLYFESVRWLADTRIPPLLAETIKPPTPMAEMILELLLRPLRLMRLSEDKTYQRLLVAGMNANFFGKAFSEQVRLFILPALSNFDGFPVPEWIRTTASLLAEEEGSAGTASQWMLYSFLRIVRIEPDLLTVSDFHSYLTVLKRLSTVFLEKSANNEMDIDNDEDDDNAFDSKDMHESSDESDCVAQSKVLFNSPGFTRPLLQKIETTTDPEILRTFCAMCHNLLLSEKHAMHSLSLLSTLAFRPSVIRRLWNVIVNARQAKSMGKPTPLLSVISKGVRMNRSEQDQIVPCLAVFTSLFGYLLVTVHDTQFFGDTPTALGRTSQTFMPFTLQELVPISLLLKEVCLGLVELAFPDSKPSVREEYQQAVRAVRNDNLSESNSLDTKLWSHLFKRAVDLLQQLYTRDTRRQFCPDNHWICGTIVLQQDEANGFPLRRRGNLRSYRPFQGLRVFTRDELAEEGPPMSTKEIRLATILREMPYTVTFSQRLLVFTNLIARDKSEHQGDIVNFGQGKSIHVSIRRNYIYEDAFDKLTQENEPNMKLKMRVQLKNVAGLDEAGIDGGGLFREFLTVLLKTAFDPNRGFFKLTADQNLYPNPSVHNIEPNFLPHYYFIGRMLGKALYERHLVELPLAGFFLAKLLGSNSVTTDIDHLASLDPELYKNLLYLKTYAGDVQDLNLDFTIVTEDFGKTTVEELKPGGAEIPVVDENRIEYIHMIADYKLNRQIKAQCNSFRQGVSDVINLDWLRMFSCNELQTIISGAESEIDIEDLEAHTKYGNGFENNHETIVMFWRVVRSMSERSKRALLKFVTSCSRPPLLGFKELNPPFCIQNVGEEDTRLPTASTCMNLLKLPQFTDEQTLKEKLYYAIESGAGFELS